MEDAQEDVNLETTEKQSSHMYSQKQNQEIIINIQVKNAEEENWVHDLWVHVQSWRSSPWWMLCIYEGKRGNCNKILGTKFLYQLEKNSVVEINFWIKKLEESVLMHFKQWKIR